MASFRHVIPLSAVDDVGVVWSGSRRHGDNALPEAVELFPVVVTLVAEVCRWLGAAPLGGVGVCTEARTGVCLWADGPAITLALLLACAKEVELLVELELCTDGSWGDGAELRLRRALVAATLAARRRHHQTPNTASSALASVCRNGTTASQSDVEEVQRRKTATARQGGGAHSRRPHRIYIQRRKATHYTSLHCTRTDQHTHAKAILTLRWLLAPVT